jgi:hypothetical protein
MTHADNLKNTQKQRESGSQDDVSITKEDSTMTTRTFQIELTDTQAWALAAFIRRTYYLTDVFPKAKNVEEAYKMDDALEIIQAKLRRQGYQGDELKATANQERQANFTR